MIDNYFGRKGQGFAHGKVILGGEHSVVHGKPAIVLPVPLYVRAETMADTERTVIASRLYKGNEEDMPVQLAGYFDMIGWLQKKIGIQRSANPLSIQINSNIPLAAGLGSSAAVANAIAKSILDYYQIDNLPLLYEATHIAEVYAHGNPSGLDTYGTHMGVPLWFVKKRNSLKPELNRLSVNRESSFVVALSGIEVTTKEVVEKVALQFQENPAIKEHLLKEMGAVVLQMRKFLIQGNIKGLGQSMTYNHQLLRQMGVSSTILDHLVKVAVKSGAAGAKLTGKGIGGAIIALAENNEIVEKLIINLQQAGASQCFSFQLKPMTQELDGVI